MKRGSLMDLSGNKFHKEGSPLENFSTCALQFSFDKCRVHKIHPPPPAELWIGVDLYGGRSIKIECWERENK